MPQDQEWWREDTKLLLIWESLNRLSLPTGLQSVVEMLFEHSIDRAARIGERSAWKEAHKEAKSGIGISFKNGEPCEDTSSWDAFISSKLASLKTL